MYKAGRRELQDLQKVPLIFLVYLHEENPTLTIAQLRVLITDRSKFIFQPEALEVLDAYIKAGYGEFVPTWR